MLASINPLGERGRNMVWGRTAAWYVVGSVLGGASTGALAGAAGVLLFEALDPSTDAIALVTIALCAVCLVFETGIGGIVLPSSHRQVNQNWLPRYRGWVYGMGFGFQLGIGLVTIVTTSTVYLTWLLAALTGSVGAGAAVGAVFGLVRSLPILSVARVHDPATLRDALRKVDARTPLATGVTRVALVGALCAAVVLAVA